MSVGIVEHSIFQYVLQYGFAILQYIAIRFLPYCCTPRQHTFVSPSTFLRRAVVSYWRKYVHEVLANHLGGLSLPRKSVVRLTDRPDMTLDVYCGRKTTMQQQQPKWRSVVPSCSYD